MAAASKKNRVHSFVLAFIVLLESLNNACGLDSDYAEPLKENHPWKWGLPEILAKNDAMDPRLVNCLPHVNPGTLCHHPGGDHNRHLFWDSKDSSGPSPVWAESLRSHHTDLLEETYRLPKSRFVPYCHHHDDCTDPSWKIMPLYVLENKVHSNLAMAPAAARALDFMIANIPGLITAVISLSEGGGHITPHCDAAEGFQFVRHLFALRVPEPAARFKICGHVYEWEEKAMMSFNNSIPHEIINPSTHPRIVLLFDVLLPDIHESDKGRTATMKDLNSEWARTLDRIKMIDSVMMQNSTHRTTRRVQTASQRMRKRKGV